LRPVRLIGRDGLTLEEAWQPTPTAYRTVAIPGFPNFFMLMGPNSPIGNASLIAIAETQADYRVVVAVAGWRSGARGCADRRGDRAIQRGRA